MSAEEDGDKLKLYWEHFFKAETGTYEKSTWLDLFSAEFLIRLNEGADPKELIKFCPVSGVVSLVGCELLCGIHRVTSAINAHYTLPVPCLENPCIGAGPAPAPKPPGTDPPPPAGLFSRANAQSSTDILRKYLLSGVAWRCLILLKALGVEGLSCCRQLASVLIWLCGELSGAAPCPGGAAAAPNPHLPRPAPSAQHIYQLFSERVWSKQKAGGQTKGGAPAAAVIPERGPSANRSKRTSQVKVESPDRWRSGGGGTRSDPSTETGDSDNDLHLLNRSLTVRLAASDDFEYFTSPARSADEHVAHTPSLYSDPFHTPRRAKPKADDYMTERHRDIVNSEISSFEFTLMTTDLLQELCRAESSLSGSEGSQISVQCINFSLRNLCSLQFGSPPTLATPAGEAGERARIKLALTELLMVSLDKVLVRADLCAKLINNGILPMLLRILEDVICKSTGEHQALDADDVALAEILLKYVFGIAYSITAFFHCLLMQCRSVDKLREFTDQFKLYGECRKGALLKECVALMVRVSGAHELAVPLVKRLVETLGRLVSSMKRVRSEVVHTAACGRARHKACRVRVAAGVHHHHDILGEASVAALPLSSRCCVAVLCGTLTALLTDERVAGDVALRTKVLRVMLGCGVCCCFSAGYLVEHVVRVMLTHAAAAALCLQLLERTVYGELGASVLLPRAADRLPCSVCEPCEDKSFSFDRTRFYSHGVGSLERKSVWSFLIHYNSLLQLDNHNSVLHATVAHLLRVTPRCRQEMKHELLFSVVYPTFIVAKHRYMIRNEEAAYFLTVSCLNIFSSLLNTVSFAEQFIQKGGLSYVLELVALAEFSEQCCSILEIAIVVEIIKVMRDNAAEMGPYRDVGSLPSVRMLLKSLADATDRCYKVYRLRLPRERFEELTDVSVQRDILALNLPRRDSEPPRVAPRSAPQEIPTSFAWSENSSSESMEGHVEVMRHGGTFWKCCAALCLYSPLFREQLATEPVLLDSYVLLKLLLHQLCGGDGGGGEGQARLASHIMEALLTVQFALSDVTSERSKEASCSLVREALSRDAGVGSGAGGLRALCETLLRVAGAEPSLTHAMPPTTAAKLPPLACVEGSASSLERSSSEDSVAAPYASEHSEPERADLGYEADVEVAKFELPTSHKGRKQTASTVTSSSGIGMESEPGGAGREEGGTPCSEYSKSGALAYPELCLIVVDILTHLIHKAVQGDVGSSTLARACCGRLCAALSRAPPPRAPPPRAPLRLLTALLSGAGHALLSTAQDNLQELRVSVLELVETVAGQGIEPYELAMFLQLFKSPAPPLPALLATLSRLAAAAQPHTPAALLACPLQPAHEKQPVQAGEGGGGGGGTHGTSQSHQAESFARHLRDQHLALGIKSAWSCAAVRCGVEGAGWTPWLQGFALSAWLRVGAPAHLAPHRAHQGDTDDEWDLMEDWQEVGCEAETRRRRSPPRSAPDPRELQHLFSIGTDALMFEVWLDADTGSLMFKLTRPEAGSYKVLSETQVEALPLHRWSCVGLNVREVVHKRRIHVQVTVFVNGCECETVSLPLQGILVRKIVPTSVLVGHCGAAGSAWYVSAVSVYRAPALDAAGALRRAALGPDVQGALDTMVERQYPNYALVITPELLDRNIDWDQVYEMSSTKVRELEDNLLLTFCAHSPHIINLYHQTVSLPTVFAGRVGSSAHMLASSAAGLAAAAGPASSIPETLCATWTSAPLPSRHQGLAPAVCMLGGPDVLLFLFARVVELEGGAREQALALWTLLRVCLVDNALYSTFYCEDSLAMLHTVLSSAKCRFTEHMLKSILEASCSAPVLSVSGGTVTVRTRSDAAVLEPRPLVVLVRAWRDMEHECRWETEDGAAARGSLWALMLRCLSALLHDDHPRRGFNQMQLNRLDLLTHLLLACKERFLNSDMGALDSEASRHLVCVVRGLVGAPPLLCHLALLTDLLVLLHQASDTFVTHSRANFYFLLTSETQETSENQFLKFMSRRKSSRRTLPPGDTPRARSAASSHASDEPVSSESSLRDDSHTPDTAPLNLLVKEARKHNISSTSTENSDVAPEEGGGGGEAGAVEGALTEYVVVDVDDVTHTTVEMCSSGIYHQRRLRAGAEGGWAVCEGLLLLLHDTINVMSDHELTQAVYGAIQAESLVVLGNHRSGVVRAGVVRALTALQRRAPHPPHLARRLKLHAHLTHLANQISLYPGTWELAASCAALLTKCDVPLEDQLDEDIWTDVTDEFIGRAAPLLALLPCCVHDVPLAHNLTLIVRRVIHKASLKALAEVAVVEVVVRSIRAVGSMPERHFEGRELLLQDLYELLNRVALKALDSHHSMQTITEIQYLLTYIEQAALNEDSEEPPGAGVWRAARDAQCELCSAQLLHLDELLGGEGGNLKQGNYFTSVLSSAVSLSGEPAHGAVPRSELATRRRGVVARAVPLFLTRPAAPHLSPAERKLFETVFTATLTAISGGAGQRGKWWGGSVSGAAGATAEWTALLHELCWWALSGCSAARTVEAWALRALYEASELVQLHLTPQDPAAQRKLAVYLLRSLQRIHAASPPPLELAITDWARGWAVAQQGALPDRLHADVLRDEAARAARADRQRWARTHHAHRPSLAKVLFRLEAQATKLTESAMWMTRQVVDVQNAERKAFMEHLRRSQAETVACAGRWQRLIEQHTHEQGLWHDPASYPQAWALDATEGPGRVRVRLRRAHLALPPRFLKEQQRWKAETIHRASPLRSVVGVGRDVHRGLVARLQLNETVTYMARVVYVTVTHDTRGELLLSDRSIHFVPEDSEDELDFDEEGPKKREKYISGTPERLSWTLDQVRGVATRRWCLQERAVELFLTTGHAHLLAFTDTAERTTFLKALAATSDNHNTGEAESLAESMSQWRSGQLTNWEYLMRLNGLAGRSYNDLMQYPVYPFVLADYCSRIVDLREPSAFRDLARPMAVQNRRREQHYVNTYNDLMAARREGCSALLSRQPHHYASLYSNSGAVLHYLVRVPPFTELFLNYQDNNFDMPDRTFHSLATTWRLITNDSPTDVKELIPELFFLPELFNNTEGLNLGVRQCGAPVDNVELPPWAAHDARLFTLIHRQALESALVTEQLPHWIDLVFGYKQVGQPAIDAINVFPACTYYGFDPSSLADSLERTAAEAMVRTYGQAPRQLLRAPHPRRQADLDTQLTEQVPVWAGVQGARWGSYCGSPALPPPVLVQRRVCAGAATLHGLATARAVAVAGRGQAIVHLHGGSVNGGAHTPGVSDLSLGLLSWGHSDRALRLKRRRDLRPDRVMTVSDTQQVTVVSSSCLVAGCPIFLGHASGRIQVLRGRGAGGGAGPLLRPRALSLLAHRAPVTDIHVCTRAGLVVSVSQDGMIVLWDLNKLSYIRTLPNRDMLPVARATISETLCDVCTVHDLTAPRAPGPAPDPDHCDSYEQDAGNFASLLRVHTVNATFVGSVKVPERVTCVCYSNAPEGVSVNSVAAGLWSGGVRLYSSWDLRPLTYIPTAGPGAPLLSISYSSDSSVLFGCYGEGAVVAWESAAHGKPAPLRILSAHALF